MARFDVCANTGPHAHHTPYLLDVQSDWLQGLDTRVVIPLRRTSQFPAVKLPEQLCPVVTVAGEAGLLETPKMAAVQPNDIRAWERIAVEGKTTRAVIASLPGEPGVAALHLQTCRAV